MKMMRLKDASKFLGCSISTCTRHIADGSWRGDFEQGYIVVNVEDALEYYRQRKERVAQNGKRPPGYWANYMRERRRRQKKASQICQVFGTKNVKE